MGSLWIEPGSRFFRVRDSQGRCSRFSSYLVREARTGDGICLPEDLEKMDIKPEVIKLWPWSGAGAVRDLPLAGTYLGLLRKRFTQLFRRLDWNIVMSPMLLETQSSIWRVLLRDLGVRKYRLISNLDRLSAGRTESSSGLFLHWGSSGGDLGVCLHGETYGFQRMQVGESCVLEHFRNWLSSLVKNPVTIEESHRILRVVAQNGLSFPAGRLVEVSLGSGPESKRLSLRQDLLFEGALNQLMPQIDGLEDFVRDLPLDDHRALFKAGLTLTGEASVLPIIRDSLQQTFEFPVQHWTESPYPVLTGLNRN